MVIRIIMVGLALWLASCGADSPASDDDLDVSEDPRSLSQRYAVGSAESGTVWVVDQKRAKIVATLELGDEPADLFATNRGRYGLLLQPEAGRVRAVDGGAYMVGHGDHYHTTERTPQLLEFTYEYPKPLAVLRSAPWLTVFFAGDGSDEMPAQGVVFDERTFALQGMPSSYNAAVNSTSAKTLAVGSRIFVAYQDDGAAVQMLNLSGEPTQTLEGCTNATELLGLNDTAALSCSEGLGLVPVTSAADELTMQLVAYPMEAVGDSPRRLWADERHGRVLVVFAQGLWAVHRGDGVGHWWPLASEPCDGALEVEEGKHIVILGSDGTVRLLDVQTGQEHDNNHSLSTAFTCDAMDRPRMAVGRRVVVLTDVQNPAVVELSLDDLSSQRRFDLLETPGKLVILGNDPDLY